MEEENWWTNVDSVEGGPHGKPMQVPGTELFVEGKDLMRCVAAIDMLSAERMWQKFPDPRPDLTWHKATCTAEKWSHTDVKLEIGKGIAYVTLNRPNANNSLSESIYAGLDDALLILHERTDLRVVVFTGEGKMFCSGRDLDSKGGADRKQPKEVKQALEELGGRAKALGSFDDGNVDVDSLLPLKRWHTMNTLPQFTICLVNGSAMGLGLGFVSSCDMSIAVKGAFFEVSDVKIGGVPATIAPYVVAKVGPGVAKNMYCKGENMNADKAYSIGLVNEVVDDVKAGHKFVAQMCETMLQCGPKTVTDIKMMINGVSGQAINEDVMFYTTYIQAMNLESDEAKEGREALASGKAKSWEEGVIKPLY